MRRVLGPPTLTSSPIRRVISPASTQRPRRCHGGDGRDSFLAGAGASGTVFLEMAKIRPRRVGRSVPPACPREDRRSLSMLGMDPSTAEDGRSRGWAA
jgi:hypothetical protein